MERRKHTPRARTTRPKPWKAARDPRIQDLQAASDAAAFAACFDASPNIACLIDAEQRLLALNPRGRARLAAAAPGAPASALYMPWAARVLREEALPAARRKGLWRGELDLRGADGLPYPIAHVVEFRPATQQRRACYQCLSFELSEDDQHTSLLRFKRLFEGHPQPMWVYALDSLRFLVVNDAAIRHYGYSEAEFLAMTIKQIRPPEELDRLAASLAAAPAAGVDRGGRWTHCKKDGSRILVDISSHPVTVGGQRARFVFAHDVTEQLRMADALHASRELKQLVINHIPHQIFWKGLDARYRGCNAVFARAAGLASNEEVVGKSDDDFPWAHNAERIRADDRAIVAADAALLNQEDHMLAADGSLHWYLINKLPLHDQQGRIIGLLGTIEDVSERKRAELTLQLQGRALEASGNAVVISACGGAGGDRIEYANPAFAQLSGCALAEVAGRSLAQLLGRRQEPAERAALAAALQSRQEVTLLLRHGDAAGGLAWSRLHVAPVRGSDGAVSHHVCVLTDMTATIDYQDQLEHQASHDALTGLPNRNLFADRLGQAIKYAQRYGHAVWIVFLDLDNFKLVNDSLGHQAGDALLRSVAARLREGVRDSDTVARLGGDEFLLILRDAPGQPAAAGVLQQLLEDVAAPLALDGQQRTVTCSIGVSVYPNDGAEPEQLLKQADIALYRAKDGGRNQIQFYEPAMHARISERATIEAELRHALERGQLSLHYQPRLGLRTGEILGMEALLRWQHPQLGAVAPARFIGVAEETGLIVPIGRWALRTACAQNQAWQAAGLAPLRLAVNLSARQFRHAGLVDDIVAALADSGLAAQYLELELTESVVMQQPGAAVAVMARLRKLGIRLAIDDFGSGHSSLAYLRLFPLDYLKIDQSFVHDMLGDPNVAAIVRSVIALGHSLNFKVVAEGVESEAQLAYLRRYGCDEMQGFLFSRAVEAGAMAELMRQERCLPPQRREDGARRTLLLLDDEPHILAALARLLKRDGYTILRANTAAEAFELLALHEVQVIVSDQRMPQMNGTEFLSRVKQLYPRTVRIILSGYTELDSVLGAINSGEIYRFYTKPWDDQNLRANIQEAFQYHQLIHGQAQQA
ncbi:MAG: EAL domain-containing protein [Pseudomonadota bacterium]